MANYTGVHCPVCNKRFVEEDDVVVCPICGTPHHRSCYDAQGKCAFHNLHIKGHTWQRPEDMGHAENKQQTEEDSCPSCGAYNPKSGLFCQVCGAPLGKRQENSTSGFHPFAQKPFTGSFEGNIDSHASYRMAFGGLSPDEKIADIDARDIALYVGTNSQYFLPRFKQMTTSHAVSPNFAAFFFHFLYFFYRKMYLVGFLLLGLLAITQIPALFIAQEYTAFLIANFEDISIGIMPVFEPVNHLWAYQILPFVRIIVFLITLAFSLFANRIYLHNVLKNVTKIKEQFTDEVGKTDDKRYTESLIRRGRTNRVAVMITAICVIVVYFLTSMAVAFSIL